MLYPVIMSLVSSAYAACCVQCSPELTASLMKPALSSCL